MLNAFMAAHEASEHLPCGPSHGLALEAAVVQLQDRWAHFCRELVLLSAVGLVRTMSGLTLAKAREGRERALLDLRATFTGKDKKRRDWEPNWFDPSDAIDAANRLKLQNFANVAAALGATPAPLEEIRAIRNFFAHRGRLAAIRLRRVVGPSTTAQVHDFLTERLVGGPVRFEVWVETLQRMARASID